MACCAAVPTFAKQHMLADRGERATLLQKYLLRIFYAVSLIVKVHLEPLVCVLVHYHQNTNIAYIGCRNYRSYSQCLARSSKRNYEHTKKPVTLILTSIV